MSLHQQPEADDFDRAAEAALTSRARPAVPVGRIEHWWPAARDVSGTLAAVLLLRATGRGRRLFGMTVVCRLRTTGWEALHVANGEVWAYHPGTRPSGDGFAQTTGTTGFGEGAASMAFVSGVVESAVDRLTLTTPTGARDVDFTPSSGCFVALAVGDADCPPPFSLGAYRGEDLRDEIVHEPPTV